MTALNLHKILQRNLPWSPMDFIRGISAEGDRGLFASTLTKELPSENDLRFMHAVDRVKVGVFCERLPWDSKFFGYDVAKLWGIFPIDPSEYRFDTDYSGTVAALLDKARKQGIHYLFAAVDSRDLPTLRALGRMGFQLIETRVYYHMDITNYSYQRFDVRKATPNDIPSLGRAAQMMANPFDRFHSDPFIKREDADRLMYKWVEASIVEGFADAVIVPNASNPTAFCTVKYHQNKWDAWQIKISQVPFTAVSNEFKGWFRKLLSEVHYHVREQIGAEHMFYITQITNKAVIWVLESLGYRFGRSEHIFSVVL